MSGHSAAMRIPRRRRLREGESIVKIIVVSLECFQAFKPENISFTSHTENEFNRGLIFFECKLIGYDRHDGRDPGAGRDADEGNRIGRMRKAALRPIKYEAIARRNVAEIRRGLPLGMILTHSSRSGSCGLEERE